jgi:folate-binding protein YgfZ
LHHEFGSYRDRETASRGSVVRAAARPGAATGSIEAVSEIEYLPCGISAHDEATCALLANLAPVETEYAALRRGAGVLDCPQRGTLHVRGGERLGFLDRMLTAAIKDMGAGSCRASFWLNRQGRIDADLFLIERGADLIIDVDRHQTAATASSLRGFLFSEDVTIEDASEVMYRLAVHGPLAEAAVGSAAGRREWSLPPGAVAAVPIAGADVTVARLDQIGAPGLLLAMERQSAAAVWRALVGADDSIGGGRRRVRPAGWYAFNIARLEAGTPLFNIDFGPFSLPHESGVLHERVSFKKGCYLGQEIVARLEHLGKPKQVLRGLRVRGDRLPVAGAQVFDPDEGTLATPIGTVTSSTLSPMLGAAPIAFAMIRSSHAEESTMVLVNAEGEQVEARVGPLRFWTEGS